MSQRSFAVRFPSPLVVADANGADAHTTQSLRLSVAPASLLRLQRLLARAGYLPLDWAPTHAGVQPTMRRELAAAVEPPAGHFRWRYPHIPHELQALWKSGGPNSITRGAVMMFEHDHHLAVDAIAGHRVWAALLADAVAGKRQTAGYSYVYVHRAVPQLLTLWHNGPSSSPRPATPACLPPRLRSAPGPSSNTSRSGR